VNDSINNTMSADSINKEQENMTESTINTACLKYGEVMATRIHVRRRREKLDKFYREMDVEIAERIGAISDEERAQSLRLAYEKAKAIDKQGNRKRRRAKLQPVRRMAKHELFEMAYED